MLSIMIQEIEGGAPWPSQLLQVKLSPIPKKIGRALVASGKVRLIAVSSHVYRCWGSMRAQQCSLWLSQITPRTVRGGIKGRGTFDILADVALTWHESLQADQGDPRSQFAHLTLDAATLVGVLTRFLMRPSSRLPDWWESLLKSVFRFLLTYVAISGSWSLNVGWDLLFLRLVVFLKVIR
eukprot:4057157-Amphidinium_carterae.3